MSVIDGEDFDGFDGPMDGGAQYPDPIHDGGDEFFCADCGEECDSEFGMSHDGLCEDCDRERRRDEAQSDAAYFAEMDDPLIDGVGFADPGGRSALRAATPDNPRVHSCPTCKAPNVLTRLDVARGYQCDRCADRDEGGGY